MYFGKALIEVENHKTLLILAFITFLCCGFLIFLNKNRIQNLLKLKF
jgi:hypothetical protein